MFQRRTKTTRQRQIYFLPQMHERERGEDCDRIRERREEDEERKKKRGGEKERHEERKREFGEMWWRGGGRREESLRNRKISIVRARESRGGRIKKKERVRDGERGEGSGGGEKELTRWKFFSIAYTSERKRE